MITESTRARFSLDELALARYDERGVFKDGRGAELAALRAMGRRDPSLGRIYEGHFNGVLLVALYGTDAQRARAADDVARGELFGVWNTQDADGVTIALSADHAVLGGAKTWASAADTVTRALITARRPDGGLQMCLVPLDEQRTGIDTSAWRPLGMQGSNSYRISFQGMRLEPSALIGIPGDYERSPWFLAGAVRFAAVHAGIVERLVSETIGYIVARGREADPLVRARIGEMRIASVGAVGWLQLAQKAWEGYDSKPSATSAAYVAETVDMARTAIERAGLDCIENAVRTVGAHGLVEPLIVPGLVRDLHMYLRQPAPDAALLRVADAAIGAAVASRSAAVAISTGSSASDSNAIESVLTRSSVIPKGFERSTHAASRSSLTP